MLKILFLIIFLMNGEVDTQTLKVPDGRSCEADAKVFVERLHALPDVRVAYAKCFEVDPKGNKT